jgi:PilZ domain
MTTTDVIDLRKADRFVAIEPVSGTFGAADIMVLDLSLGGAKISHPQPIRIGTRARISFRRGDITATVQAHVVWSHLNAGAGGMVYHSGLKLDSVDPQYALAINTLLRANVLRKDVGSLDRKRERMAERELARKTLSRVIPSSSGVE